MRTIRNLVLATALASALFTAGCGGSGRFIQRGMDAYKYGDYPLAMETFDYVEKEAGKMNDKGEVRYLVYRGLTAYKLGKKEEALKLLRQGKAAYKAGDPKWLSEEIEDEMTKTLAELGSK
jgi:hypothetical protein